MYFFYIPLTYSALADFPQGGSYGVVSSRVVKVQPKYTDNQHDSSTVSYSPLEGG